MQVPRIIGIWDHLPKYQSKVCGARKYVAVSEHLSGELLLDALKMKPKLQWRPWDVRHARNMTHFPKRTPTLRRAGRRAPSLLAPCYC